MALEPDCKAHYVMSKTSSGVTFQGNLSKKLQLRPSFKDARKQLKIRQVQEAREAHRTEAAESTCIVLICMRSF